MVQEIVSSRRKSNSVPTLQASPQALTRMLEEKEPINSVLKRRLKAIFDRYEALVRLCSTRMTTTRYKINADSAFDPAPNFLRGDGFDHVRTFSPLELVTSALLICYHMNLRTDAQLLDDVKDMRRHLRVNHKDLRVNAQCWATAWEYIVSIKTSNNTSQGEGAILDSEITLSQPSAHVQSQKEGGKKSKESAITFLGGPSGETAPDNTETLEPFSNNLPNNVTNKDSQIDALSALGQSSGGIDTSGRSKCVGQAKADRHDRPKTGPERRDNNLSTLLKRSASSSDLANSEIAPTTVGISSRITTGDNEHHSATNGGSKHKVALRVDTNNHKIDDLSNSGDSLSSVPSSALESPRPQELPVHSRKRNLDDGNDGMQARRELKKSKH
jgi:hypothetical protein